MFQKFFGNKEEEDDSSDDGRRSRKVEEERKVQEAKAKSRDDKNAEKLREEAAIYEEKRKEMFSLEEEQKRAEPKRLVVGKFEDLSKEAKNVLSTTDTFDGFRFEVNKVLVDEKDRSFQISHAISMGSAIDPPAYNFAPNVLYDKITMLSGRIDTEGQLMARWQQEVGDDTTFRLSGQASNEPHSSIAHLEMDHKGDGWFGTFKWGFPGAYVLSYMQYITPNLSLGLDTVYHHKQGISLLTLGGRYETPKSITSALISPTGHVMAAFDRKITERINFASELNMAVPTLDANFALGFEYTLRTSHIKARMDTNMKVHCVLEEMLNQNTRFCVSAELDHSKKTYRFGIGVMMQV